MPDNELPFAAGFVDHRRTIAELLAVKRTPQFLAGVLVESHDGTALAAHHADKPLTIDQRMRRIAPDRRLGVVFLFEIVRPQDLSGLEIEAKEISLGAQRVHFAAVDVRRASRPE